MSKFNQFYSSLIFLLLLMLLSFTSHATSQSSGAIIHQSIKSGQVPEGISTDGWGSIQAQIKAGKYKTYVDEKAGYHTSNPAHGWQIHYGAQGATTLSPRAQDAEAYHLGLTLKAIGYTAANQTLTPTLTVMQAPQTISHDGNILEYYWTDTLTERWINSETSLEQWFLLSVLLKCNWLCISPKIN